MNQAAKRQEWANKIEQWRLSGKSAKSWCKEHRLPYTTFMGWLNRFHPKNPKDKNLSDDNSKSNFIELKGIPLNPSALSGISLQHGDVLIHLSCDFNANTLKRCLSILEGIPC